MNGTDAEATQVSFDSSPMNKAYWGRWGTFSMQDTGVQVNISHSSHALLTKRLASGAIHLNSVHAGAVSLVLLSPWWCSTHTAGRRAWWPLPVQPSSPRWLNGHMTTEAPTGLKITNTQAALYKCSSDIFNVWFGFTRQLETSCLWDRIKKIGNILKCHQQTCLF